MNYLAEAQAAINVASEFQHDANIAMLNIWLQNAQVYAAIAQAEQSKRIADALENIAALLGPLDSIALAIQEGFTVYTKPEGK